MPVTRDDIEAAEARIRHYIRRTPVLDLAGEFGFGFPVALKLELLQHTGSFKARGAFNRVLSSEVSDSGIITASGGNHGLAVAHVARTLDIPAEIFVPSTSPAAKIEPLRRIGPPVTVTVVDGYYDEAQAASDARAAVTGALVVHPYDMPEAVAGQGTCGREVDEQCPGIDTLLVTVGGGGFIAGMATWFEDRVNVVAVEPETSCCFYAAHQAGRRVEVDVGGVAADSTGARQIGALPWEICSKWVDNAVTVTDEAIIETRQTLWSQCRIAAEPGGACALAALLSGAYTPLPGERVAAIVCGGNADPAGLTI